MRIIKFIKRKFKSKSFLKVFLFAILFCNVLLGVKIYAANLSSSSSSIGGVIPNTAGQANIFSITPADVNKSITGCDASSNSGLIGAIIKPVGEFLNAQLFSTGVCIGNGSLASKSAVYQASIQNDGLINYLAQANSTILEQRPLSGVDYVQGKIYALAHPNTVYAQESPTAFYSPGGTGYDLLRPIQSFWSWSVRLVYAILILFIIVIAFAIMFRQRLPGGVEVTIQNAIPSIALAMVLVPLSYAISGVFIDVITVGTNGVHEFLLGAGAPGNAVLTGRQPATNFISGGTYADRGLYPDDARVDWLHARDSLTIATTVGDAAQGVGDTTGLSSNAVLQVVGGIVNGLLKKPNQGAKDVTWIGDILQVVISVLTIWIGIKILIKLLGKYLMMITLPILSPLIFSTIALPGNGTKSIMTYVKTMLSGSLFYIVTYACFLLSIIFTNDAFLSSIPNISSYSFTPPLIGIQSIGFSGSTLTRLIFSIIGLGIYFSIPRILEDIDKALGTASVIPQFIKTPWEALNESYNKTFRQAPAIAARAAKTGLAAGRNAVYAPTRAATAAMDLRDRLRGKTPGDVGTYRYNQRQRLAQEYAQNKQKYEDAKNPVERAKYAAKMAAANIAGAAAGTGVGTPAELKDKEPSLEAKFVFKDWTCPDNTIAFSMDRMLAAIQAGGASDYFAEVTLTAKNFKLPLNGQVEYGWMKPDSARQGVAEFASFPMTPMAPGSRTGPSYVVFGSPAGITVPATGPQDESEVFARFGFLAYGSSPTLGVNNAVLFAVEHPAAGLRRIGTKYVIVPNTERDSYKFRMKLRIVPGSIPGGALPITGLFGVIDPVTKNFVARGDLTGKSNLKSQDIFFRVLGDGIKVETKAPLSITMTWEGSK